jgi:hypothetical protein
MTKKEWMELYGTPDAPSPDETGWGGFSHPTRKQWASLHAEYERRQSAAHNSNDGD